MSVRVTAKPDKINKLKIELKRLEQLRKSSLHIDNKSMKSKTEPKNCSKFSPDERNLLLKLVLRYKPMFMPEESSLRVWEKVAKEFVDGGGTPRSIQSLRTCWSKRKSFDENGNPIKNGNYKKKLAVQQKPAPVPVPPTGNPAPIVILVSKPDAISDLKMMPKHKFVFEDTEVYTGRKYPPGLRWFGNCPPSLNNGIALPINQPDYDPLEIRSDASPLKGHSPPFQVQKFEFASSSKVLSDFQTNRTNPKKETF